MVKILFAASESVPFIKTGGLADVMGALPKELVSQGIDARVVIPDYSLISEADKADMKEIYSGTVNLAWRQLYYGVKEIKRNGVTTYFIDNEWYFKRDKLYGFADDAERFAYFCRAVLAMLPKIGFQPDIIHCNDWHTGLMGVFLKEDFAHDSYYKDMKVVYTIHNLKYQGIYDKAIMTDIIGLPQYLYDNGNLECDGCVNYMKSGLVYADFITTVSHTYAEEITYPYFGERLDGYIRTCQDRIEGIINGLDEEVYNPATDPYITAQYDESNVFTQKRIDKEALQKRLGLPVDRKIPIISLVSRLVQDKGMDLLTCIMDELLQEDVQVVIVGTGDKEYEDALRHYAEQYPAKVSANILFDEELAHWVYAGSDIFVMPSRYEPCGLSQLIALKYGTIPVVRETGGLKDTVIPFVKKTMKGNGLRFLNFNAHELLFTIKRALSYYDATYLWEHLVHNAITSQYGWSRSAAAYLKLYKKILTKK
jgi:starch synthase